MNYVKRAGLFRAGRALMLATALAGLSGCAAVSALSSASQPLAAYTLSPVGFTAAGAGSRHVVVETPSASGAIATDRILVKPSPLQAAYLPGARWIDAAPVMIQTLMVQSLQSSGAFRLVNRGAGGLLPDYTVLTEIRAFQAEPGPVGGPAYTVRVALTLTLVREIDGRAVASRNVEGRAGAASDTPLVIAEAFDAATTAALRDAVGWIAGSLGAGA